MILARRFIVSGRVQGVGFRFFTEERARLEGLNGWVRNGEGGRVEIEAEGDADAMERFERAIRRGPAGARVDACETTDRDPMRRHTGFSIRA